GGLVPGPTLAVRVELAEQSRAIAVDTELVAVIILVIHRVANPRNDAVPTHGINRVIKIDPSFQGELRPAVQCGRPVAVGRTGDAVKLKGLSKTTGRESDSAIR